MKQWDHESGDRSIKKLIKRVKQDQRTNLTNFEANKILTLLGITTPPTEAVHDLEQAQYLAREWGYPVVLKLSSSQLLHKKDQGGVISNIKSSEELWHAFEVMRKRIRKLPRAIQLDVELQLQKQVERGVEVLVGIKQDPSFGPVLMVGAGGSLVELVADRNLLILPATHQEIKTLVEHSKIFRLLQGYRGEKAYPVSKLYDLIERLAALAIHYPTLVQFEINPVILTHTEAWAVDGKGILSSIQD